MKKDHNKLDTQGCLALVEAMVKAASQDFLTAPAGSKASEDAVRFFKSKYFTTLTGADGRTVLKRLEKQRDANKEDKQNV